MSAPDRVRACGDCLRRMRLLALLAGRLERARPSRRLPQVLALGDADLIAALGGDRAERLAAALAQTDHDTERGLLAGAGLAARCRHDRGFPPRLLGADDAPALLTVAGGPAHLDALAADGAIAVAVVGARRATGYGLEVARSLGRELAAAGITVVSGMALGVDAAAHGGALEVDGPTIAVLAGGADRPYPASKAGLHRRIVDGGGCVVSEMPPGFTPFKWGFPARNRIIAGLADAIVVVEAAARSGSLITAELGGDLGRLVGAVPGPVTAPMSVGTNALLRDGAAVVRGAQDVLDALLGPGVALACRPRDPGDLEPRLRDALERVGPAPLTTAAVLRAGDDVDIVLAALTELELLGWIRRAPGGAYVRIP